MMRVLALNPFHAGSHRAFLEGWAGHSRHEFTILSLPGRKWKWRMRHAPVEFAAQLQSLAVQERFDCLFSTDMLDLPTLRGLDPRLADLPAVVYFHENQLNYPVRVPRERDHHFAFTNLMTASVADAVWFNSTWHRDLFLEAAAAWVTGFPDFHPVALVERAALKSHVVYPGIDAGAPAESVRSPGPLRIAWVSRWEFDKQPEVFFAALAHLEDRGVDFRLNVLGEKYAEVPDCFRVGQERFAERIDRWGYLSAREEYVAALRDSDVVVSTAAHEFFGLGVLEAVSNGCQPVVPNALAYPEVLQGIPDALHDNTAQGVADALMMWSQRIESGNAPNRATLSGYADRYDWSTVAPMMDEHLMLTQSDA